MRSITDEDLLDLREQVRARQSEKRFAHTLGVEQEAAAIGEFYLPEQVMELRAAALLHDLTKCIPDEEQIVLCDRLGIPLTEQDQKTPQILHGWTAEKTIEREFPHFATPEILRAVHLHTTGSADMTTFDKIIFLSDYIEAGRPYPDCKMMREAFWSGCQEKPGDIAHLDRILCRILSYTLEFLKKKQLPIAPATAEALRALQGNPIKGD